MHRFSVITLFPELIEVFRDTGIVRRAVESGIIDIAIFNPRSFCDDARATVDDAPYGGGPGMVMLVRPIRRAISAAKAAAAGRGYVVYLTPQGRPLDQRSIGELSRYNDLVLLAGRYEGVDERVVQQDVDAEWSLGDFVLSGGELAAMAVIDAVVRTLPGALGDDRSAREDSFSDGLLDYPHYTRPQEVDGQRVPPVLLSGDHAKIARWRRQQALGRTWLRRRELLKSQVLSVDDQTLLDEFIGKSAAAQAAGLLVDEK